ncbi:hypothetical protein O9G_000099 [Rozella allomycis CSF55]|uniref:Uncharacterized protein n=1 Tax=Rozella allomycis (strain CSF55) TaxID=988480 RepID=A0A075ANU5_ROZAC|nr:hypothetical protein O9G_000099 [Rozella allomycis CSF55]|eukprot:EPZ31620.1 hypothetical protein O9G_000099 [Rozella allomycis CSF55]
MDSMKEKVFNSAKKVDKYHDELIDFVYALPETLDNFESDYEMIEKDLMQQYDYNNNLLLQLISALDNKK